MEPPPEEKGSQVPYWVESAVGQPLWDELLAARPICKAQRARDCRRGKDCPMVHANRFGAARNVGKIPHASFVEDGRRMYARPPLARLFDEIARNRNLKTIVQTPVTTLQLRSGQRHLLVLAGRSQGSAGHGALRANIGYAPLSGGGSVSATDKNPTQSRNMLVAMSSVRALDLLLGGGAEAAATTFPCGDVVRGSPISEDRTDMLNAVDLEEPREWFYKDGTGSDDLFLIATFNGLFASDKTKAVSLHGSAPFPTGVICSSGGYKHAAVSSVAPYALLVPPAWLEDTFPNELRALAYPPAYAAALRRACDKVNGRASPLNDIGRHGIEAALAASSSAPSGVWETDEDPADPSPPPAPPAGLPLPVGRVPPRSTLLEQADSGRDGAGQQPGPESGRQPQSGAAPVPTGQRGGTVHASAGQARRPRSRSPPSREAEWTTDAAGGPPWRASCRAPRVPPPTVHLRRTAAVPSAQRGSSSLAGRDPYRERRPYDPHDYL